MHPVVGTRPEQHWLKLGADYLLRSQSSLEMLSYTKT